MVVSVPWCCKDALLRQVVTAQYVRKLLQGLRNQATSQLTLGAILCQLCQMELQKLQLAGTRIAMPPSLHKQLQEAGLLEKLLCTLQEVCLVSATTNMYNKSLQKMLNGAPFGGFCCKLKCLCPHLTHTSPVPQQLALHIHPG